MITSNLKSENIFYDENFEVDCSGNSLGTEYFYMVTKHLMIGH